MNISSEEINELLALVGKLSDQTADFKHMSEELVKFYRDDLDKLKDIEALLKEDEGALIAKVKIMAILKRGKENHERSS